MVQEMNILRCYSCHIFQVHIVKKANKWQCKICNEKQSVQHIYYQGSGQECRLQVQHLNFMKHVEEQQRFEKFETTEFASEKNNSLDITDKPVITHSKWDKYMAPRAEYHEMGLNDDNGIDPPSNCKKIISSGTNSFQVNLTTNKHYFNEKFIDEEEIKNSSLFRNNIYQNLTAEGSTCDNKDISIYKTGSCRSKNMLCENRNCREDREDDVPLIDKSCESIEKKDNITIIRKDVKRKSHSENVVPELESNSFAFKPGDKTFKRSKIGAESLLRKQSLRDIVDLNRFNAGKSVGKTMEKNFREESKLVLTEINNSRDRNIIVAGISDCKVKRKTIFETDCDDLDEILDF